MEVNKINVLISTHTNKGKGYLYNEVFSFAKEHNIFGRFGHDYFELNGLSEKLLKDLEEKKITFMRIG